MPIPISDKGRGNENGPEIALHCMGKRRQCFPGGAAVSSSWQGWYKHSETRVWHEPVNLNVCTPYDSALPLLAAGPGRLKQMSQEDWYKESSSGTLCHRKENPESNLNSHRQDGGSVLARGVLYSPKKKRRPAPGTVSRLLPACLGTVTVCPLTSGSKTAPAQRRFGNEYTGEDLQLGKGAGEDL